MLNKYQVLWIENERNSAIVRHLTEMISTYELHLEKYTKERDDLEKRKEYFFVKRKLKAKLKELDFAILSVQDKIELLESV